MDMSEKDKAILENIASSEIATRLQRFWGAVITQLFLLSCLFLFNWVLYQFGFSTTFCFLGSIITTFTIHNLLLIFRQQTFGMLLMGTKIVSDSTTNFSIFKLVLWRSILNWILPFIPTVNVIAPVNYLNIFGNSTNRCVHDELSNSIVIKIK